MTKSSTYKKKGEKLYWESKYLEAIKNFDNAIKVNPKDYMIWFFRGNCKYELEQYEQAVKDFDEAIELNPKDYIIWFCRGSCKYELEQYEDAINNLDKTCLLYTSPSPRDRQKSRMPSSA